MWPFSAFINNKSKVEDLNRRIMDIRLGEFIDKLNPLILESFAGDVDYNYLRKLPKPFQYAWVAKDLYYEIPNGSFAQYMYNSSGLLYDVAFELADCIGDNEFVEYLKVSKKLYDDNIALVIRYFECDYDDDDTVIEDFLETFNDEVFYKNKDRYLEELESYIYLNRDKLVFVDLQNESGMNRGLNNEGRNVYIVTIDDDNEFFAVKKGLNPHVIIKGPFGDLEEFGNVVRYFWFFVYAIAFVGVRMFLWWVSKYFNFDYPLLMEYVFAYMATNLIFSFSLYHIKVLSVQFLTIPFVIQIADDPDDAMLKAGNILLEENDRNRGKETFSE